METQVIPDQQVTEQPKPKKPRRTLSVGFNGPEGASLRVAVRIHKDGTAKTWVTHRATKNAKSLRGATELHANLPAADKAMEKLIERATKMGWERRERKGFAAKPDAFDVANLPKPKTGKK